MPVRASDADRERTAAILRGAAGQGLLTLDEVDERLVAVYAAVHVTDLAPVTADLPEGGRRLAPVDLRARSRARAIARAHLLGYVAVVLLMVGIWVATGADYYFWPVWPAVGMLPAVVSHLAAARWAGDPSRAWAPRIPGGCGAKALDQTRHRLAA
ncbi:MAG TPA: DUF1707 domain-containing protein [Mycobacteriales bacterium]|jgi:hypothetical protein|nr:DUF1707 domain-containing protein [Mycobacteriales bacterium]